MNIKVFAKVGLMKNEKWIKGTVLEEYENIFVVQTAPGSKISVEKRFVKPVIELIYDETKSCYPELNKFVNDNWISLRNNITEAVSSFFTNINIDFNEEDKIIECKELGLSLAGAIKEIETIGSFKECPAWEISITEVIPATKLVPQDFSERIVSCESNNIVTAKLFVDSIWSIKSDFYWSSKHYG